MPTTPPDDPLGAVSYVAAVVFAYVVAWKHAQLSMRRKHRKHPRGRKTKRRRR